MRYESMYVFAGAHSIRKSNLRPRPLANGLHLFLYMPGKRLASSLHQIKRIVILFNRVGDELNNVQYYDLIHAQEYILFDIIIIIG